MTNPCPTCGANMDIVGRAHNCRPRPAAPETLAKIEVLRAKLTGPPKPAKPSPGDRLTSILAGKGDPAAPPPPPIPAGVYWSTDSLNFYDAQTFAGMGQEFFDEWEARFREFPEKPALPLPTLNDDGSHRDCPICEKKRRKNAERMRVARAAKVKK